jgi:hypothetical protein
MSATLRDSSVHRPANVITRSPSFTLGTALLWLGHDCPGGCPPIASNWRAEVWFVHLPDTSTRRWTKTLVDVDFADEKSTDGPGEELLRQINACVRPDHIRVRERSAAERARVNTEVSRDARREIR